MELIEFEWTHCPGAYSIVHPKNLIEWTHNPGAQPKRRLRRLLGGRIRVDVSPDSADFVLSTEGEKYFETYRPTEFPTLFRIFADMPATAEGMRNFFNRFGPVEWDSDERFAPLVPAADWYNHRSLLSEVLSHHASLRHAIDLFEAGNLSELSRGFDWAGSGRLRTKLRPQATGKLAMVLVPSSLIQFLWFQLAQYAVSDARLFRCEQCGHPFLVGSKTGRRSKAKYCSDSCRLFRANWYVSFSLESTAF